MNPCNYGTAAAAAVFVLATLLAPATASARGKQTPHPSHGIKRPTHHPAKHPNPVPPGWPKVMWIPRIGVHAAVENTPLIQAHDYEAPFQWSDTAWFSRGPKPGDPGHSLIFGHLDSYCCPAIFWNLARLRKGDRVYVQYRWGHPLRFTVNWVKSYWESAALTKWVVYYKTHERALLLITCSGIFHGTYTGYDHRLIVYAHLDPVKTASRSKKKARHA